MLQSRKMLDPYQACYHTHSRQEKACKHDTANRRTQPWLLQDGTGTVTHRGHLEGGLGGATSSAGYFILIKEGSAFTALPADQFYTFRPKQK